MGKFSLEKQNKKIRVEFGGGAENLFNNQRSYDVFLIDDENEWLLSDLLSWIVDNLLVGNVELFIQNETLRPGILVLINDTDWELMDTVNYKIQPNDCILFISTLHGG